jgi:hypothetical protein
VRRAAWLLPLVASGCLAPASPPTPDLARPLAPKAPLSSPPLPSGPVTAEVAISGSVTRPAHVGGDATLWVVDAPCWRPGGRAFASTRATRDQFSVEVYVPQGTKIWVCAALGDGTRPLTVYGQADRSPLDGVASAVTGLTVPLKKGKRVAAPARR